MFAYGVLVFCAGMFGLLVVTSCGVIMFLEFPLCKFVLCILCCVLLIVLLMFLVCVWSPWVWEVKCVVVDLGFGFLVSKVAV